MTRLPVDYLRTTGELNRGLLPSFETALRLRLLVRNIGFVLLAKYIYMYCCDKRPLSQNHHSSNYAWVWTPSLSATERLLIFHKLTTPSYVGPCKYAACRKWKDTGGDRRKRRVRVSFLLFCLVDQSAAFFSPRCTLGGSPIVAENGHQATSL